MQEDQLKAGMAVGAPGWGVDPVAAVRVDGATGLSSAVTASPGNYLAYYAAVAAALRGEAANPVTADQAIAVMEVIEAGVLSTARRAEVTL